MGTFTVLNHYQIYNLKYFREGEHFDTPGGEWNVPHGPPPPNASPIPRLRASESFCMEHAIHINEMPTERIKNALKIRSENLKNEAITILIWKEK